VFGRVRARGGTGPGGRPPGGAVAIIAAAIVTSRSISRRVAFLRSSFSVGRPRLVQREDLVSSSSGRLLRHHRVGARRTFFSTRSTRIFARVHTGKDRRDHAPADNWKVFILEDILEGFSQDIHGPRESLGLPCRRTSAVSRSICGREPLSLLGYSCAIHVFDQSDSLVSRFGWRSLIG